MARPIARAAPAGTTMNSSVPPGLTLPGAQQGDLDGHQEFSSRPRCASAKSMSAMARNAAGPP